MENQSYPTDADPTRIHFTISQVIPLSVFCFFVTVLGTLGNGTVLYSSTRYNAIRLDKVSLIFVQNLAIADIIYTICVIFPQMITYFAGGWVLGKIYCFVNAQLSFIPGSVNALTVLLITSYRLRLVTNPFFFISSNYARAATLFTWIIGTSGTVISLAYASSSSFSSTNAKCLSSVYVHSQAAKILQIAIGSIILIPLIVITVENIILCVFAVKSARKHSESHKFENYKALVLVCCLSGVFIISWVPYVVFSIMKLRHLRTPPSVDLLAFHCIFINSVANPILYSITNRRFGLYLKKMLRELFCSPRIEMPEIVLSGAVRRADHAAGVKSEERQLCKTDA